jgi:RimJ/RimL family protein N-acetyltransferase
MMDLQPRLSDALIELRPLEAGDFDRLHEAASDPLIWEQHPDRERWQRDRFTVYFASGLESKGALVVLERATGRTIGCSRYYDYKPDARSVAVGFTFLARPFWGSTYNRSLKKLMLDHAFRFVDEVLFHVGEKNIRSQKAMEKMGAENLGPMEISLPGNPPVMHVLYRIGASAWKERR